MVCFTPTVWAALASNHSEVGSSFIHFNYTPNQDKATPSMMGNVHQGVMLNQPPVFLGGQGGLVGPVHIAFGCITAAGSIIRNSEARPGRLLMGGAMKTASLAWRSGVYTSPDRIFKHNLSYIAGLFALKAWYAQVRPLFITGFFSKQLVKGLQENLDICIEERIKRLNAFGDKLQQSRHILFQRKKDKGAKALDIHDRVLDKLNRTKEVFEREQNECGLTPRAEEFLQCIEKTIADKGTVYVDVIQGMDQDDIDKGSSWLAGIETRITGAFDV